MRFLGLNKGCTEQLAIEKKFACCKVTNNEVGKVAFEVQSLGKNHSFCIEQIIAFFIIKLKEFYQKADYNV